MRVTEVYLNKPIKIGGRQEYFLQVGPLCEIEADYSARVLRITTARDKYTRVVPFECATWTEEAEKKPQLKAAK